MSARSVGRAALLALAAALVLAACCSVAPLQAPVAKPEAVPPPAPSHPPAPDAHLAAFSADLVGSEASPSGRPAGSGRLVAVYDHKTGLFRWKLAFSGFKGSPRIGLFGGSAKPGAHPVSTLPFGQVIKSPMEGRANLSEAQAADLLAGRWYASIRSSVKSRDEIRGPLVLHE